MTDHQIADTQILEAELALGSELDTVVAEAVEVIDEALVKIMQRELVSSGEVADLLLDVRTLLTTKQ